MKHFLKAVKKKQKTFVIIFSLLIILFIIFWTQPNIKQYGTIKIWDKNNTLLYESAGTVGKKIPIDYEKLPKNLINAAIVSEDITFWNNPGVDFRAIIRSTWINVTNRKIVSGASTITQQLARTSIISPNKIPSRSIARKLREILIAIRLTLTYSKKEIITMYFNQMYFGNLTYGIQSASLTYFNKDVSQLSLAESAFLVGLLSSPDKRDPFKNIKAAQEKQKIILDLMVKHNLISNEAAEDAKQEEISITDNKANIKAPHFTQYILNEIEKSRVNTDKGINVYTTLDYPTFLLSEEIAKLWVSRLQKQHDLTNAAMVVIDNKSGKILNMMGGIDYSDIKNSGQVNMTTALRQPGSALKPITYATAFMQGYTPATPIYDIKKVYKTKKGEGFTPNNYDGRFHGIVLAREALASSFNLPAVEMLNRIGMKSFLKVARDLGITTLTQEERYDLALTLGGGEVKLLDLTNVYASFAREGRYIEPYAIQKIVRDDGRIMFTHKDDQEVQALGKDGKQVAYLISNILSDPKARIPGFSEKNPLVLSRPAAVKTGTTTDWHDNWTVGYTTSYTVGVWVGNNDNHPMREITGVVGAGPIWNQFFEEFLKGKSRDEFARPDRIKEVEICQISGQLPDDLCPEKSIEIFIEGTEPKEISHLYKKVKIDKRNNLLTGDSCSKEYTEEKVFIDYPPEVYTWALEDNQQVIPRQFSPFCIVDQQGLENNFIEITYPKEKTVFEYAPQLVNNQAVVFELNVSPNITKVQWIIDGLLYKEVTNFPFKISWKPNIGKFTIQAVGINNSGEQIDSKKVNISVVDYKGNN